MTFPRLGKVLEFPKWKPAPGSYEVYVCVCVSGGAVCVCSGNRFMGSLGKWDPGAWPCTTDHTPLPPLLPIWLAGCGNVPFGGTPGVVES